MNPWIIVNQFRKLESEQKVNPLQCPDCGARVYFILGLEDNPVLHCYYDGTTFKPGSELWNNITAVVKEHYLEE